MEIKLNKKQRAFVDEVKTYMDEVIMTPDMKAEYASNQSVEGGGPVWREKCAQLGRDGWFKRSWDKAIGGNGAGPIETFLMIDTISAAGFPYPLLSVNSVGPYIAASDREELKAEVVPRILHGEAMIALGYSEPASGSDLAALTTKAERAGDEWIINGQKTWTSTAHFADYIWLAARTDPDSGKRHKGLTVFMIPTSIKGFSHTKITTLGVDTTATYYENIRLPDKYRVSDVNGGWALITGALNLERLLMSQYGKASANFELMLRWCSDNVDANGEPFILTPWVQSRIGEFAAKLEALKVYCWKTAWKLEQGSLGMVESSVAKVYGSELWLELHRGLMEFAGQAGALDSGPGLIGDADLDIGFRLGTVTTVGGGVNDIQRDIIAMAGLQLQRAR